MPGAQSCSERRRSRRRPSPQPTRGTPQPGPAPSGLPDSGIWILRCLSNRRAPATDFPPESRSPHHGQHLRAPEGSRGAEGGAGRKREGTGSGTTTHPPPPAAPSRPGRGSDVPACPGKAGIAAMSVPLPEGSGGEAAMEGGEELSRAAAPPLPNLTPRHRQLIPTPCGPIKPCSELSFPVKIYFCVTILSLLSVIGLTIETLVQQTEEDFTISLIQLIGVVFCVYYVTRGILQENRQELIVFVLSILLVMFRSIVNFTVLSAEQKPKLLARFILILLVGSFDVICAIILIQSQSMMAFRVGGALESLQSQYFMLNLCFSMLTFDLQAQLCLCVLLISLHEITLLHNIISATGVLWACLKVTISIIAILKELKPLVWIFMSQNVPEVVYLIYLLYTVIKEWGKGNSYTLEAAFIIGSCISVAIKSVLFWALIHVYRSFGQGLRERMFSSYGRIDS